MRRVLKYGQLVVLENCPSEVRRVIFLDKYNALSLGAQTMSGNYVSEKERPKFGEELVVLKCFDYRILLTRLTDFQASYKKLKKPKNPTASDLYKVFKNTAYYISNTFVVTKETKEKGLAGIY